MYTNLGLTSHKSQNADINKHVYIFYKAVQIIICEIDDENFQKFLIYQYTNHPRMNVTAFTYILNSFNLVLTFDNKARPF